MIKRILDQWTADQEQKRRWREEDRAERKAAERAAAEKAAAEADAKALTDAMVKAEAEAKAREAADAQTAKEAKDAEVMRAVIRDMVDAKHVAATLHAADHLPPGHRRLPGADRLQLRQLDRPHPPLARSSHVQRRRHRDRGYLRRPAGPGPRSPIRRR